MNYRSNITFRAKNKKYFAVGDVIDGDEWSNLEPHEQKHFSEYSGWVDDDDEDMEDDEDIRVNSSLIDDLTNPTVDPYDPPDMPDKDFDFGGGSSGGAGASDDW